MQPGYRYTKDQVRRMMTEELAQNLQHRGYVLRVDDQGYYSLVHHTAAFGGSFKSNDIGDADKARLIEAGPMGGHAQFDAPAPIVKRTPQERLDSLVKKLWPTASATGHLPGLKDEDILPIVLNVQGKELTQERITGETVRAVAASFLDSAEKKHEEKLSKQITRHED
jgi:hypothetical protein